VGLRLENVAIFYGLLEYFMNIWDILWPFVTFRVQLWNFFRFGIRDKEKSGNPDIHWLKSFPHRQVVQGGASKQDPESVSTKKLRISILVETFSGEFLFLNCGQNLGQKLETRNKFHLHNDGHNIVLKLKRKKYISIMMISVENDVVWVDLQKLKLKSLFLIKNSSSYSQPI
jgi:hypothetical protein